MTTAHDIDWPQVLAERLTTTHLDVLRELLSTFIYTLMGAEADALCGATFGERSTERTNQRNGYRNRQFDTRTGSLDLAIRCRGMVRRCKLAAGTAQAGRAGADDGGSDLLPAGCVDAADGQARRRLSASRTRDLGCGGAGAVACPTRCEPDGPRAVRRTLPDPRARRLRREGLCRRVIRRFRRAGAFGHRRRGSCGPVAGP